MILKGRPVKPRGYLRTDATTLQEQAAKHGSTIEAGGGWMTTVTPRERLCAPDEMAVSR